MHFVAQFLKKTSSCILTSKAKREPKSERKCNDNTSEERLNDARCDAKLGERCENRNDPDCPACERSHKTCRHDTCCTRSTRNNILYHFSKHSTEQKDERCYDDLRKVIHNYL